MGRRTVRHDIDIANLPPLTEKQKPELKALAARPEGATDHGDIPPLDEAFWKNAVRNPVYRPNTTSTTVRVDTDVLLWLRSPGKGYQSRINAILRRAMLALIKPS
jgi:uncharacterized protein (DUF4415 family)